MSKLINTVTAEHKTSGGTAPYSDHSFTGLEMLEDRFMLSATPTPVLSSPTLLVAAVQGTSAVQLNWTNSDPSATGYYILRSVNGQAFSNIKTITSATTTSFVDTRVAPSQTYRYEIKTFRPGAISAATEPWTVTTPLATPTNLIAGRYSTSINMVWRNTDPTVAGYAIYRSVDGAMATLLTNLASNTRGYADRSIAAGHSYTYTVGAVSGSRTSGVSNAARLITPMATPSALAASTSGQSVFLSWIDNDAAVTGYCVLRSMDCGAFSQYVTIPTGSATSYQDSSVLTGHTYSYKVQAYDAVTASAVSASRAVTVSLATPTGLAATATTSSVTLTWNPIDPYAYGVYVLRSTNGVTFARIAAINGTAAVSYTDKAVKAGIIYQYALQVVRKNVVSARSSVATSGTRTSSSSNIAQAAVPAASPSDGVVTITTRYGNELVITATGASDTINLNQNGSFLIITANVQTYTYSLPAAGVFVYTRGGNDVITTTQALTVRTTIVSVDTAVTTINSAGTNVSAWIDSTDKYTGTGYVHSVASYAGGVSKADGASLANPTDSGTTKKVDLSLWGTGPVADDERQGTVGDCYFVATLASLANTNPTRLQESAVDMGDGTYVVQYFRSGQQTFVRVSDDFSVGGFSGGLQYANLGANNVTWVMVMEKAWAYFRTGANTYASTSSGWMGSVFTALNIANADKYTTSYTESTFYTTISGALSSGHAVTGACYAGSDLVNGHAYSIMSASKDANGVTHYVVRNPWGFSGASAENSQGYATLTFAQMVADLPYLSVAV